MSNLKNGLMQINAQDLRVWELVTNVPQVGNVWSYVCLILNIFLPGTGTMLCACVGDANLNKTQIAVGIVQLLTAVYFIGWCFSIYWGYLIVKKSKGEHNQLTQLISSVQGGNQQQQQQPDQFRQQQVIKKPNNPYEDQA